MIQRILALAAGFLVVATLGGWGQGHRPAGLDQPQAAAALRAVVTDDPEAAHLLPPDFEAVMGYQPAVASTGPTRANGGCSSPFGGTRYDFTPDCQQHDLGYDLLRYAKAKGHPLGSWARRAVDRRFADQTQARCHELGCRITAGFYIGMVEFNSWRQGYGTPVVEPIGRLVIPAGAGLGTTLLLGLLPTAQLRKRPVLRGHVA